MRKCVLVYHERVCFGAHRTCSLSFRRVVDMSSTIESGGFMKFVNVVLFVTIANIVAANAVVISHERLARFENSGNQLTGIATPQLGAHQSEVWRASISSGSQTPVHTHRAEEIVILLLGTLEAVIEGQSERCNAPCAIVLPANKEHYLKNVGEIATDHLLIMPSKSKIVDSKGDEMTLPWRN